MPNDGKINDNSGMVVRLLETKDGSGNKTVRLRAYFTDANANHQLGRTPNDISWDMESLRNIYLPSYKYAAHIQVFPAFPPENDWNATEDYFTFVSQVAQWEVLNSIYIGAGSFALEADLGTMVVTDPLFLSSGTMDRQEIALHSAGNLSNGNFVVFNDFAMRFLRKK